VEVEIHAFLTTISDELEVPSLYCSRFSSSMQWQAAQLSL